MRIGGLIALVLIGGGLAACSTAEIAEINTKSARLTPYNEAYNIWGTPIVQDERVDVNNVEITVTGLSMLSAQRATDLARFHAAILGRQDTRTQFSLGKANLKIVCGRGRSSTHLDVVAIYGPPESLGDKVYEVDAVIAELESEMRNPQTTHEERQRIFIANQYSCSSQRLISPDQVRTKAELEAAERAEKTNNAAE